MQQIIYAQNLCDELDALVAKLGPDRVFVLTDTTTQKCCLPLLESSNAVSNAQHITIGSTDANKTLESLAAVWEALGNGGASRHSLLICLGGGMITDLGGFAAATFKRGITFVNIPTTLLAMVDAAVGGKTGINFNGLKNEVGVFREAETVIIDTQFLRTLDAQNLHSGYAEMLKHALLDGTEMWASHLNFELATPDYSLLQDLVRQSIDVKRRIVAEDPTEKGIRKALNLGHTTAHAFESLALHENRVLLHGYAVAWGLAGELYLSATKLGFPTDRMRQTVQYINEHYGKFEFTCKQYEQLYDYMTHDKKNVGGVINFTLLNNVGDICLNQHTTKEELFDMFDFLREGA